MKLLLSAIGIILFTTILNFGRFRFYLGVDPYTNTYEIQTGTAIQINQVHYSLDQFQQSLINTIEKANESVVSITASKEYAYYYNNNPIVTNPDFFDIGSQQQRQVSTGTRVIGGGSGIFVHKDGYILTNNHVVNDPQARYLVTFFNGKTAAAEYVWLDPTMDIAILKIKNPVGYSPIPALMLSLSDEVQIGQFALAAGNERVSLGIIAAKNTFYETDASLVPGNSGGPLLDINGRVMAINTAVSTEGSQRGFAIPINQEFMTATLESIEKYGKIMRPSLELVLEQARLQTGDSILSLNRKKVTDDISLLMLLNTHSIGEEILLAIARDGRQENIKIKLE